MGVLRKQSTLKMNVSYPLIHTRMCLLGSKHSWNSPLIKGGGRTFQKLSHIRVPKMLLERRGSPWKGGGGGGALFLLLHSLIGFTLCVGKSKVSFITFWFFSLFSWPCTILIQVFLILKHCIICIFLIHSGSVQKMPSALFI